jgi:hypothetical protein
MVSAFVLVRYVCQRRAVSGIAVGNPGKDPAPNPLFVKIERLYRKTPCLFCRRVSAYLTNSHNQSYIQGKFRKGGELPCRTGPI